MIMTSLTVRHGGEIALPADLRTRYGIMPDTRVRMIETKTGILLVPLTGEPMNEELAQELAEWQSLSAQTWDTYPYEDDDA